MRRLGEILGLAAAYFGTGKLALLLAIPPGFAAAIWPPSGIALAALLLLGSRAWPGVFLGSLLVNLSTTSPPVAAAIAVGATVQASLGAFLIRKFVGPSLELLRGRDISKFLLLGGPASCIVSPTVGAAMLYFRHVVQIREVPFTWFTWWVGDVIGVAVVAPLVLIAFGTPREVWRRRGLPVALPLGIMLVVTTAIFVSTRRWERLQVAGRFSLLAQAVDTAIADKIRTSTEVLRSLENSRAVSPRFDRQAFRSFAEQALQRCPDLRAVSWNPRVTDAERDAFERGDGDEPFRITERDPKERLVPAPRRSEYVPVRYIEPYPENASVVGFDVSSSIIRFEAMKRARDTGAAAATRRFQLIQDGDETFGVLVFLPSCAGDAATPIGYFVGVVRLDRFFAFLDEHRKAQGIDVRIHTASGQGGEEQLLWPASPARKAPAEIQHETLRTYWGAPWRIQCGATPEFVAATQSWRAWGVLAGGLAAAGLLGAFLLAATARSVTLGR